MFDPEAYAEPCRTSKMEVFAKIVDDLKPLTIFTKHYILDVWQGFEYACVIRNKKLSESTESIIGDLMVVISILSTNNSMLPVSFLSLPKVKNIK